MTPTKPPWIWIIIVANLCGLLVLAFVQPAAMLGAGALMPAHAGLATDCFACHAPFRGAASERCVACHAVATIGITTTSGSPIELEADRTINPAFHQKLREQNCRSCHTDHQRQTERRFSHDLLQPAARGDCVACHAAPTNEVHRDLRVSCNQCHTTEHWSLATFDHAALATTTLTQCESCHAAPTIASCRWRGDWWQLPVRRRPFCCSTDSRRSCGFGKPTH
jgi:hypothetical protein